MIRPLFPPWTWLVSLLPRQKDCHVFVAYYFNGIIPFVCPCVCPFLVWHLYFLHKFHSLSSKTFSSPLYLQSPLFCFFFKHFVLFMQTPCAGKKTPSNFISPQLSLLNNSSKYALRRIAREQPCLTMAREQQLGLLFCISLSKILGLLWSRKFCYFSRSKVTLSTFFGDYLFSKHSC